MSARNGRPQMPLGAPVIAQLALAGSQRRERLHTSFARLRQPRGERSSLFGPSRRRQQARERERRPDVGPARLNGLAKALFRLVLPSRLPGAAGETDGRGFCRRPQSSGDTPRIDRFVVAALTRQQRRPLVPRMRVVGMGEKALANVRECGTRPQLAGGPDGDSPVILSASPRPVDCARSVVRPPRPDSGCDGSMRPEVRTHRTHVHSDQPTTGAPGSTSSGNAKNVRAVAPPNSSISRRLKLPGRNSGTSDRQIL